MRQAIEEKFILDVLQNYTTYKLAFRLAHNGKDYDDKEVERSAALKGIMGWVRLHPYNIAQKVQVVVEHFRQYIAPLLNGQAKAMVVVGSRQEVVRWKIAIDKYIKDRGYGIGTLVAFSGEVKDTESGPDPFTETSHDAEPQPARPRHSRSVQHRRVSDPPGGEQVPDRLRSAAALRDVRRQATGGHSGRADPLPAEPRPSRQGHDLRAGLRERRGGRSRRRSRPTTRRPNWRT